MALVADYREIIRAVPGKRSGQPCIRDTRITVHDVLSYLAAGDTIEDLTHHFPELTEQDIRACFAYAAEAAKVPVQAI